MMKSKNDGETPFDNCETATNWEELPRPKSYQQAVAVASQLFSARLNADIKARWHISIERTAQKPPRFFLKTDLEGSTRAEFFARRVEGDGVLSVADRAMAARLHREEIAGAQGKGRPAREQAALKNPAGQSIDVIIFHTCSTLAALGWKPLSRANETGPRTSIFDAVAEAVTCDR